MHTKQIYNSHILAVDDEKLNLSIISEILEDAGFTNFETTHNPEDALDRLKKNDYDLLLLDLLMPRMNGKELIHRLNHFRPEHDVNIMILSAVTDKKIKNYMLSMAGATDYLTKPFDEMELLTRIRKILENRIIRMNLEDLVMEKSKDAVKSHMAMMNALANAANYKDDESPNHTKRVSLISRELAAELGWPESKARIIESASSLHDVGKIGIPDSILLKREPLTQQEDLTFQRHTIIGASLILGSATSMNDMIKMTANIALSHHEKYDGNGGYPIRLKGDEIPLEARIVSLADAYDTILTHGLFNESWTEEKVFQYIRSNSGKQFDPEVVKAFIRAFPKIKKISETYSPQYSDDKQRIKQIEDELMPILQEEG